MAITFTDGGATVTFDSGWEFVLWALVLPFVIVWITGGIITLANPVLAYRLFINPVVATVRLIKSLLVLMGGPSAEASSSEA